MLIEKEFIGFEKKKLEELIEWANNVILDGEFSNVEASLLDFISKEHIEVILKSDILKVIEKIEKGELEERNSDTDLASVYYAFNQLKEELKLGVKE